MHLHQPKAVVPDLRMLRDENNDPIRDAKGKPVYGGVEPMEHVRFPHNAAKLRKFMNGELDYEKAFGPKVPIWRGLDSRTFHQLKSNSKYMARVKSREKAKINEEITVAMEKENG